jgi:hypothetical protein
MTDILPTQIDYTSRDYASLRQDLIARVQKSVPEWQPSDPSDFGIVLVEAFAHLGDIMSYYIDRAANESTLSTATRRASVLALSRDLGYEPAGYTSSSVTLSFANSSGGAVTIPEGTVVTAAVEKDDVLLYIPFETDSQVIVSANSAGTVTATQGQTMKGASGYGESLGLSNGAPNQYLRLPSDTVVKESVVVYVYDGVNYYPWTRVSHVVDYTPTSRVFRVVDDGYGGFYVQFGDGVSGMVPPQGHVIYATYRKVDGTNGNVSANTIKEITSVPGLNAGQVAVLVGTLTVTNENPATGGSDPEDLASVRNNAAQAYRANNRAVSLEDYQTLALQVPGCGKASAQSSVPSSVILSVAPSRNVGVAEARPGYLDQSGTGVGPWVTTAEYDALKADVKDYVTTRALAGTTVTMVDAVYTPISVTLAVTSLPSVLNADVVTIVRQALADRFEYSSVDFGASVLTTDIISLVASLGVTQSVTISVLKKTADVDGVNNLVAGESEIFLLPEVNITVNATGGAA